MPAPGDAAAGDAAAGLELAGEDAALAFEVVLVTRLRYSACLRGGGESRCCSFRHEQARSSAKMGSEKVSGLQRKMSVARKMQR